MTPVNAKAEIESLREGWARDLHDKKLDASVQRYTTDAVFASPDGMQVKGIDQIRSLFSTVMKTYDSELHFHSNAIEVSGTLAYDSGTYEEELVTRASGGKATPRGGYLMVLRREGDGHWRIVQQMWSVAAPAK